MATSKFERRFTTNTGEALLGATIELIPQGNEYPEGKIVLNEHPTRKGWYYKDGVPIGEYKIYINGTLYTQNIFHSENILYYIVGLYNEQLVYIGQLEPSRIKIPLTPPSINKKGNIYFDELSRVIKIDIDGTGNYVTIGGDSSTSGVVLISGNQTIVGRKTFYVIDFNQNQPGIGFVLPLISPQFMSGSKTGAMFYDVQNNVLKISKDDTGNNYLTLGSSEGEDWISLHGLSTHDGQINGYGIYILRNSQVFSLPLRNSQNGYYAEDVPGAIYIDETNKRLLVNFGQSHYGEDDAVYDEYYDVLPKGKMLEVVRQDPKIINGDAGQFRDFYGTLTIKTGGRLTSIQGVIQIPNRDDCPDVLNWWNSIFSDAYYLDNNNEFQYRLNVRFKNRANPTELITKSYVEENEIKSWIDCGEGQFTGTATQCIVTVPGATVNDRYYVTPIGTSWNVNDMLIVSADNGQFTVTRGSGGTNNLRFYWFRRRYGTY